MYHVTRQPRFGQLEKTESPGQPISVFSQGTWMISWTHFSTSRCYSAIALISCIDISIQEPEIVVVLWIFNLILCVQIFSHGIFHDISWFSLDDVNNQLIRYVLTGDISVAKDEFVFDLMDSKPNRVTDNTFYISWSHIEFNQVLINVTETSGIVQVPVNRKGNLKQVWTYLYTCLIKCDWSKWHCKCN